MNMNRNDYATQEDFCAIFRNHLDRLYLLALVLAGDELMAEECFLAAFDSCAEENRVFKESALPGAEKVFSRVRSESRHRRCATHPVTIWLRVWFAFTVATRVASAAQARVL